MPPRLSGSAAITSYTGVIEDIEDVEARFGCHLLLDPDRARDARVQVEQVLKRPGIAQRNQQNRFHGRPDFHQLSLGEEPRRHERLPCRSECSGVILVEGSDERIELVEALDAAAQRSHVGPGKYVSGQAVAVEIYSEDRVRRGETIKERNGDTERRCRAERPCRTSTDAVQEFQLSRASFDLSKNWLENPKKLLKPASHTPKRQNRRLDGLGHPGVSIWTSYRRQITVAQAV
jgi:hypothetical protein